MHLNNWRPRKALCLLFLALMGVYHSNLRPLSSGDSLPTALTPLSLLLDGSLTLDRFGPWMRASVPYFPSVATERNGHVWSSYPIAQGVLVTPLYVPPVLALRLWRWDAAAQAAFARIWEKFVAVFVAALSGVLMFLVLERLTTAPWTWILTLVFALGTNTWATSSQALWQHTSGQLLLIAASYALVRWREDPGRGAWLHLAGVLAGIAVLVRVTNVAFAVPVALALLFGLRQWKAAASFAWPVAAGTAALAVYNVAVFGRLSGGYVTAMGASVPHGLASLLFSPGRGLLIYSPVLLFGLAARADWRRHAFLVLCWGGFAAAQLLLLAKWENWWGGYCWGPRLLTEVAPALVLLTALGSGWLSRHRAALAAFAVLAAWSVAMQAVGVYCYPKGHWDHLPRPVDGVRAWDWHDNPIARTLRGGVAWEPYILVYTRLTQGPEAAARKLQEMGIKPF